MKEGTERNVVFGVVLVSVLAAAGVTLWRSNRDMYGSTVSGRGGYGNDTSLFVITYIEEYRPGWISGLWAQGSSEECISVIVFDGDGQFVYGTDGATLHRPNGEDIELDTHKGIQYWIRENNVAEKIQPRFRQEEVSYLLDTFRPGGCGFIDSVDDPADLRAAVDSLAKKRGEIGR